MNTIRQFHFMKFNTSSKKSQQWQLQILAKIAAFVQATQNKDPLQKAVFAQHECVCGGNGSIPTKDIRMNTNHNLLAAPMVFAATLAALLVVPISSQAQSNTATGADALHSNTTGQFNTADGSDALFSNTAGGYNVADGASALYFNTTGNNNTASGVQALWFNTAGSYNTATGNGSLVSNTTGSFNTASGALALYSNSTGNYNIGVGYFAGLKNTIGNYNIGIGYFAGQNITTGSNNIMIGNPGTGHDSGVIRIGTRDVQGTAFIAGIHGTTTLGGVEVFVNQNGQLGTVSSSRRFKKDIQDMGSVSDRLMQLRPVTFRYKKPVDDGSHPLQYGLIAEEVAKVYPDLVQYDKQGKPFTIYYHLLTPMLLNALQKEHHQNIAMNAMFKVEIATLKAKQNARIANLQSELTSLKQAQQEQRKVLAKLTASVQAYQNKEPLQKAVFVQH